MIEESKLYTLRKHQQKGLDMLRQSFRQGKTRPLFYAATGYGKSIIMAHIIASALDKGNSVLVVVPYTALINQLAKSFMNQGLPKPGIIQGEHEWTDPSRRLQIGTIQTLSRRGFPETSILLVDESHVIYKEFIKYLNEFNTPVVAFTATPYTKSLGKYYDNLICPIRMSELIDLGYLSEYVAYAPCEPDLKGLRVNQDGEYENKGAGERMSAPAIVGSIVETWLKNGDSAPTVCFATNIPHANFIGTEFDRREVSNAVITAATPIEEREELFVKFKKREVLILINVGTLVAGFDANVHNIIYAKPTKSMITWCQALGRGLRTADDKIRMKLFDHSGTISQLGFPEDYHIYELDNGEKPENSPATPQEKPEKLPKKCPSCNYVKPAGENECSECGFTPRKTQDVEVIEGELKLVKGKMKTEDKKQIYAELLGYKIAQEFKGKHLSDGYIAHIYRDMTGVWPRNMSNDSAEPSEATLGFIKHKQIAWAKRKARA